jgi:hypothetical protein
MTTAAELASYASSFPSFRNRIINGDMRIDQRNGGGSITSNSTVQYTVDRIPTYKGTSSAIITAQQSTTAPAEFVNSVIFTVSTGATPSIGDINGFWQVIEGSNVADLGWGTANAQTVTLSFWVRSSVTGTYSVSFANGSSNRFYVATYSISSANTWEKKTITVAGDTDISATWATDNTSGIQIVWDLGYGTNFNGTAGSWSASTIRRTSDSVQWCATTGATFYITGVQLEVGTVATPFEHRLYGTELALCQRYYATSIPQGYTISNFPTGADGAHMIAGGTNDLFGYIPFPVEMRARPTTYIYSSVNRAAGSIRRVTDGSDIAVSSYQPGTSNNKSLVYFNGLSGVSANQQFTFHYVAISEL